ncbi:MAG: hypothetical protein ACYCU8_15595 [Ferrimicrobium acidiphilum]
MNRGVDRPTLVSGSPLREIAVRWLEPTAPIAESTALGCALEERSGDIVDWCQLEFVKHLGAVLEGWSPEDA